MCALHWAKQSDNLQILASDPLPMPDSAGSGVRFAVWEANPRGSKWDRVNPDRADLIVVPWISVAASGTPLAMEQAINALLQRLPYYSQFPDKHVLLDNSDLDVLVQRPRGHLFKTSISYRFPDIYALSYNVPDPGLTYPIDEAEFDISFQGAITTHPIRQAMRLWRYGWKDFRVAFNEVEPFWTLPPDRQGELQKLYYKQICNSRFVLCPRGRGLNSRRFFEVLAHGRIPILYADAAKLPLETQVPWEQFTIRVPEGFGSWTDNFVTRFLAANDLMEASYLARNVWLMYFAPGQLRTFIVASLKEAGQLPSNQEAE